MEKASKRSIVLWAVLYAVLPPILIIPLIKNVVGPAITGSVPTGARYGFWILSLIFWGALLELPLGRISAVSDSLRDVKFAQHLLAMDTLFSFITIWLIVLAFRRDAHRSDYLAFGRFSPKPRLWILGLLSLLPLLLIVSPTIERGGVSDEVSHPLVIAYVVSIKNGSLLGIVLGFLSVGFFGPVLEEMIFRGLLLEPSHDLKRGNWRRRLLDLAVCLLFALAHLPVSFVFPFIFSAVMIYARRSSGSLLPSTLMHIVWNSSVLISVGRVGI